MAGAGDGQLEGVDVESLLVGVAEQADEVVLLKTLGVILLVDERTWSRWIPVQIEMCHAISTSWPFYYICRLTWYRPSSHRQLFYLTIL